VPLGAYEELEFDLAGALRERLIGMFSEMTSAPLAADIVSATVPNEQGVYQLFHKEQLVYIGKTDADAGLRARLGRHALKILNRADLDPSDVSFKAIRLFVFTVMDLETELLRAARPPWNGGGFGSNDPGRERDTTRIKPTNFDALYPLDIDRQVQISIPAGTQTSAEEALVAIQRSVPWKLRRQNLGGNSRKPHEDLAAATVVLPSDVASPWALLSEIVRQLPAGWQATALRSHVILYKERKDYPDPLGVAVSPGSLANAPKLG
jgi:hypothetical protein